MIALLLAACGSPTPAVTDTGDTDENASTGESTGDTEPTTGAPPAQCDAGTGAIASFMLVLGDWPIAGDDIVLDAPCEVSAEHTLTCLDDGGEAHMITLEWNATPELAVPYAIGDTVELHLRRAATSSSARGAWTVRGAGGELLAAGNTAYSSHPDDPEFFAPLRFEIDANSCPAVEIDDCFDVKPFVIAVDDGNGTTRVGPGQAIDTASGHRMQVQQAGMYKSYNDPKFCPVDSASPPGFQFLIVERPQ
jgi:hypothetical protein